MSPRLPHVSSIAAVLVFLLFCTPTPPLGSAGSDPQITAIAQQFVRSHRLPSSRDAQVIRSADIPDAVWEPGHRGVDLEASAGQVIVASRGGTVAFAGVVAGTPVVSISHSDGIRTTYEPVLARVHEGQKVRRGEPIGVLADAATLPEYARKGAGLSWGARIEGEPRAYIDPLSLLGSVQVRLWDAPG